VEPVNEQAYLGSLSCEYAMYNLTENIVTFLWTPKVQTP
jgi:hypothetical protein